MARAAISGHPGATAGALIIGGGAVATSTWIGGNHGWPSTSRTVGHCVVKLTVTHDGFAPGTAVLPAISDGWPAVLSSLETLLETGSSLGTS